MFFLVVRGFFGVTRKPNKLPQIPPAKSTNVEVFNFKNEEKFFVKRGFSVTAEYISYARYKIRTNKNVSGICFLSRKATVAKIIISKTTAFEPVIVVERRHTFTTPVKKETTAIASATIGEPYRSSSVGPKSKINERFKNKEVQSVLPKTCENNFM